MGELGLNKIFGSIIAAALLVMGLQTVSAAVFSSGGHHGHHGEKKPYNEAIKDKYAYWTDVKMASSGAEEEVEIYDLGLLLASADASKGGRVFNSVCASCHTINEGGANGTGPNLYGLIGRDIASVGGFGYSSALSGVEGAWTYEALDSWTIDPQKFARGSAMVANVKKDPDRANLIAFLAENSPGAPAFPAPLPAVEEGAVEAEVQPISAEGEAETPVETGIEVTEPAVSETEGETALDEMDEIVDRMEDSVDRMDEITAPADEALEIVTEAQPETIIEEIVEAVEDGADSIELPVEPE